MPQDKVPKRHILLDHVGSAVPFTTPPRTVPPPPRPKRDRADHAQKLSVDVAAAEERFLELREARTQGGFSDQTGFLLTSVGDPGFPLQVESLEDAKAHIELLGVKTELGATQATLFVPRGDLTKLEAKLRRYAEKNTPKGLPQNQKLIESIAAIHAAALEQLWTEEGRPLPEPGKPVWWEVWLRAGQATLAAFSSHAAELGLELKQGSLTFPDRTVVLVHGTVESMRRSAALLDSIAELRSARENPADFLSLTPAEQGEWVHDLANRLTPPPDSAPAVCLLDTGLNIPHPLLDPAVASGDCLVCDPAWGSGDHEGHGTAMAGIALYGANLGDLLASQELVTLEHGLESVKILPPKGQTAPELYGWRTIQAVGRAEINGPARCRSICLTVMSEDTRDRGRASSWSAAVDGLAAGADDGERRLIVISAGNLIPDAQHEYPDRNHLEGIHDPGQAWNALTVGACTDRWQLDPLKFPGWSPVAPPGALSPCSSTSLAWEGVWPVKPDVVMEGGNAAIDPANGKAWTVDDLQLLSTHHEVQHALLTVAGGTSAAAASAARLAAVLQSEYPDYWPETIRALLVHSAEWTNAMRAEFPPEQPVSRRRLVRCYGLGVPDLGKARWSASDRLTLVVQDSLQPFRVEGSAVKTGEMHLHGLPWPSDVLEELGELDVELRVTLSYFVEPNPARRGEVGRHAYPSFGLRFDVRRPAESSEAFTKRVNAAARAEGEPKDSWASDGDDGWVLGSKERFRGSLHADRWRGTAAQLARRGVIAVYPASSGWWRTRPKLGKWAQPARYALVVSIHTPPESADIYTPVAASLPVAVEIAT